MQMEKTNNQNVSIWNKNFTILTVGSIISLAGSSLMSFASSLYVYEESSSTFLFALFMVLATIPGIIIPVLCGPFLDKFSRRKTIYMLDFMSGFIYLIYSAIFFTGHLNYWVLAIGNLILGSIGCVYNVAYSSFYPLLVEKGNYSKAYAVTSTIECIVPYIMPLGWLIYKYIGLGPLLLINALSYVIAAIFEIFIKVKESYVITQNEVFGVKQYFSTFRDGFSFLITEKGLFAIVIYFTVLSFTSSALDVNMLPYFKDNVTDGELMLQIVWACFGIGRIIGGRLNYKYKIPSEKKFAITVFVYAFDSFIDGILLFLNLKMIFALRFISGVLTMTSYNIRISSTQSYISDDKKGRFNGTFDMMSSLGGILGKLLSGAQLPQIPHSRSSMSSK